VNRTLLLATLAVIVVAAPLGYFVHRYQKGRLSGALLDRAEKAENEKQWSTATEYYQQYLVANPDNTEVLVRLVEAYAIGDPSPSRLNRLNSLLYRALGRVPERHDLREMLAKNLLMIGSFADAEQEAQKVIKYGDPASPTARRVIALSRFAIAQIDKSASAADALSGVVALCDELPGDAELVAVAANTLRAEPSLIDTGELPSAERADQLMDRLVEQDPNNVDARVARYSYRTRYNLPDTDRDLDAALALAPENVDVLILSAVAKLNERLPMPNYARRSNLRRQILAAICCWPPCSTRRENVAKRLSCWSQGLMRRASQSSLESKLQSCNSSQIKLPMLSQPLINLHGMSPIMELDSTRQLESTSKTN
jgi:tetratricopeptide (TPR) repeat protein